MTESEWLSCTEPQKMLDFLAPPGAIVYHPEHAPATTVQPLLQSSDRQLRLFAVGCCHMVWHLMNDERSYAAVRTAERYAEGLVTNQELAAAKNSAWVPICEGRPVAVNDIAAALHAAWNATWASAFGAAMGAAYYVALSDSTRYPALVGLLRDIFTPYHRVALNSAWLITTVTTLAESIYTDRSFVRLSVLADALEEAGCTDAAILEHCRGPGPHVRGCWVVDLLLGKQ